MSFKTEYQLHFGGDDDKVSKENYLSRLNFRKNRISHEKRHTPLIWFDLEDNIEANKTITEINNNETEVISSVNDNLTKTSEDVPVNINKCADVKNEEVNTDIIMTRDIGTQSPSKLKVTIANKKVLKPVNRKIQIAHDKPIIAYGWADRTSLQAKKTFNVKAPKTEVRSSALRAANQRDVLRKKRLSGREKLRKEKLKQQEVIDALTNFSQWETEYKHQFSSK